MFKPTREELLGRRTWSFPKTETPPDPVSGGAPCQALVVVVMPVAVTMAVIIVMAYFLDNHRLGGQHHAGYR